MAKQDRLLTEIALIEVQLKRKLHQKIIQYLETVSGDFFKKYPLVTAITFQIWESRGKIFADDVRVRFWAKGTPEYKRYAAVRAEELNRFCSPESSDQYDKDYSNGVHKDYHKFYCDWFPGASPDMQEDLTDLRENFIELSEHFGPIFGSAVEVDISPSSISTMKLEHPGYKTTTEHTFKTKKSDIDSIAKEIIKTLDAKMKVSDVEIKVKFDDLVVSATEDSSPEVVTKEAW